LSKASGVRLQPSGLRLRALGLQDVGFTLLAQISNPAAKRRHFSSPARQCWVTRARIASPLQGTAPELLHTILLCLLIADVWRRRPRDSFTSATRALSSLPRNVQTISEENLSSAMKILTQTAVVPSTSPPCTMTFAGSDCSGLRVPIAAGHTHPIRKASVVICI
jgi:hypothetical protein